MASESYSIKAEFAGAKVFLTGATGFIGGLVLELLLRTTDVGRVYVLLRSKKGETAAARLAKLLRGPMFHLVRDSPALVGKVVAVEGDLAEEGLGLSAGAAAELAAGADVLIHAAADIRLEAPIQETLAANYVGTARVLALARTMRRCAFAAAPCVLPCVCALCVPFCLWLLMCLHLQHATHTQLTQHTHHHHTPSNRSLRAMVHVSTCYVNINQARGATVHERIYPLRNGSGCEADGAAVAEELLALDRADADRRAEFYTRHWGFPNTYCLGKHLAEQLVFRTQKEAGLPIAILRPSLVTGCAGLPLPGACSNWAGPSGVGAAIALGFFPALSAHAVDPMSVWDAVPGDLVASAILATAAAVAAGAQGTIAGATGCGAWAGEGPAAVSAPAASMAAVAPKLQRSPSASSDLSSGGAIPAFRGGDDAVACRDQAPAAAPTAAAAEAAAAAPPMMIVHAGTGASYPVCIYESYNTAVDFFRAHGFKRSLLARGVEALPHMPAAWRPSARMVTFWKFYSLVKVALACFLLRLFGLGKAAQRLSVGFQQWAMNNDFKNDTDLRFASAALRQLHARIAPEERRDFLLTFGGPRAAGAAAGAAAAAEVEHPAAHLGWRQYSFNCLAAIVRKLTGEVPPARIADPQRPGKFIEHGYRHVA